MRNETEISQEERFMQEVESHRLRLIKYCMKILGENKPTSGMEGHERAQVAHDIVADVISNNLSFIQKHPERFDSVFGNMRNWLFRCLDNKIKRYMIHFGKKPLVWDYEEGSEHRLEGDIFAHGEKSRVTEDEDDILGRIDVEKRIGENSDIFTDEDAGRLRLFKDSATIKLLADLKRIDEKRWQILMLWLVERLSDQEIAARLDIPAGTVKNNKNRT